jgi:tetratricopeptide (TPR) repeat protein
MCVVSGWGYFVGVGVDAHPDAGQRLEHAVAEVRDLRAALGSAYEGEPLIEPTEEAVRAYLRSMPQLAGGGMVAMWSGHGIRNAVPGGIGLLAANSGVGPVDGIPITEFVGRCAASGPSQLLVILDTCYSGTGVPAAVDVASQVFAIQPPEGRFVWIGVLSSCLPYETAVDGEFGRRLLSVITDGPMSLDLEFQRPWLPQNAFLSGEAVGNALYMEWPEEAGQRLIFRRDGASTDLIPNPNHQPAAQAVVVGHLKWAARGSAVGGETRSWFTGRKEEVDKVVSWVMSGLPGLRVVTGSPGTGKSAIVGRVVSVANKDERESLLGQGPLGHADPGVDAVPAHAHARGLTADQLARALDEQLSEALGVHESGPRNAALLVGAVQQRAEAGGRPLVVVVDGLDEARGEAFTVVRDLLVRLAVHATVVVSTRELVDPTADPPTTLLQVLSPVAAVDLDVPRSRESGAMAMRDYVRARLGAHPTETMDAGAIADYLVPGSGETRDEPFLLARLVCDQLIARPVDTTATGWESKVASSVFEALDAEINAVAPPQHRALIETESARLARQLLTALTWGFGAGFPEEEWIAVSTALGRDLEAGVLGAADISWILDQLGRYIILDGEAGQAVYRLAHQSLADHLRLPFVSSAEQLFDPRAIPVTAALLGLYERHITAGLAARAPAYLWAYAWRHAILSGLDGLAQLGGVAALTGDLKWDVAMTCESVSNLLAIWGHRGEALPPAEEAVQLYRDLAADNLAYLPDLAGALNNLGIRLAELGRRGEAFEPAEEAVRLRRELAAENPGYLPDLANALNSLGIRLAELGRRGEALGLVEEAVRLRRELAAENPGYLPDLANALNNLGIRLAELGRRGEALELAEEAVRLGRELAVENPGYLPNLASALNNLSLRLAELGRRGEALGLAEEAVRLYSELAAENPGYLPNLASALTNLSLRLAELGRRGEAPEPAEEAVQLYRELAAENPGYLPNLATALNNLGIQLADQGRRREDKT